MVRINKDVVQPLDKEQVLDLLKTLKPDSECRFGIFRAPLAPSVQFAESIKKILPGLVLGHCWQCPQGEALHVYKDVFNWRRHVKSNHKLEKVEHKCRFCGCVEQRKEKLKTKKRL